MKKLLMIAASFLVLTRGSLAATWTDQDTGVMWTYYTSTLGNGVCVSCASEGITGGVSIPAKIDGRDVVEIEARAFRLSTGITSLRIPSTVIAIGERVLDGTRLFSDCADGFVVIDGCLFTHKGTCPSEIVVPDGVRVIANSAFERCSDLVGVTFPGTLRIIGMRSFCDTSISEVEIPEGVNEIRAGAFEFNEWHGKNASRLVSVSLPSTLEILGDVIDCLDSEYSVNPFAGCDDGCVFSFPKGNSRYSVSSGQIVTADGVLVSGCVSDGGVTIPSGVRMIACEAYAWQPTLRKITIPESVKTVCINSFYGSGLEEVVMCDGGVEVIYGGAFWYCSNLSKITLPAGLRQVYGYFCGSTPIARLEMPASVEMLYGSFESMTNLSEVVFLGDAPEEKSGFAQFYNVPQSAHFKVRLGSRGWDGDPYSAEMPTSGMWPGSYGDYGRPISTYGERPSEWDDGWWTTLDCMMSDDGWTQKDGVWQSAPWKSATYSSDVHTNYVELTFDGPGVFSCELKLKGRSQDDYAYVVVDGTDMDAVRASGSSYGDPKWRHVEYAAGEAGSHTIRVEYRIRNNYYGTEAIAYLQNVVWTPRSAWSRPDYVWTTADNGDGTVTITDVTPKPRFDVVIPAEIAGKKVTGVGDGKEGPENVKLFYGNTLIASVIIPEGVVSLGANCFYGCYCLKHVSIPSSVTSIGDRVFYRCVNLVSVYVDAGDTERVRRMLEDSGFDVATLTFVEPLDDGGPYTETTSDGITWTFYVEEGEVRIGTDGYHSPAISSETAGAVTIPSALGGRPVTSIGKGAFYNCSGLTSVTIPEGVTSIGENAFCICRGLTSVTIPSGVTSIGEDAFYNCSGLTSVTIPSSVTSIGEYAFYGTSFYDNQPDGMVILGKVLYKYKGECPSSVTIPSSVTSIGDGAFSRCRGLTSVTIPSGVTSIGEDAFYNCSGLTSVTIPSSVTSIGRYAFDYAPIAVVFVMDEPQQCVLDYFGNRMWYQKVGTPIAYEWKYSENNGEMTILGVRPAFGDVAIPLEIEGKSVTSIGRSAFYGCSALRSVVISERVSSIGYEAFCGCSGLTSVTMPSSVTSIGGEAFRGCSGLTSVSIPSGVTNIGEGAFCLCSRLASVTISAGVTSIGRYAFSDCSGLTGFAVDASNPNYCAIAGLLCSKDGKTLVVGVNGRVVIPEGVTSIGDYAFSGYSGLTSVSIPSSVTHIGSLAFYDCSGLTSVTLPEGVTSIGDGAFSGCSALTSMVIPSSVKSVEFDTFSECSGLTNIVFCDDTTAVMDEAFLGCVGLADENGFVIVNDTLQDYCGDDYMLDIPEGVVRICSGVFWGCEVQWQYSGFGMRIPSSVKSIGDAFPFYDTGSFPVWDPYGTPSEFTIYVTDLTSWCQIEWEACQTWPCHFVVREEEVEHLVIPDGVTEIKDYAFSGCAYLKSVAIPPSVVRIGTHAFEGCGLKEVRISDLSAWCGIIFENWYSNPLSPECKLILDGAEVTDLVIPEGVTLINDYVFEGCSRLRTVTIPSSVTSIGACAFYDCYGLASVTISSGVTSIGNGAFRFCSKLTSVTIPEGVTSIGDSAFDCCSGLISVTIPSSVTSIGSSAFSDCSGLTSVTIPSSVTSIGECAFLRCSRLTSVTIPSGVTSIGDGAFSGCNGLADQDGFVIVNGVLYDYFGGGSSVTIPSNVTRIGSSAFSGCSELTSVTIPSSVTSIGGRAFSDCSGLTSVTIPDGMTSIGDYAFSSCSGLTSVTIPSGVTSIGEGAFSRCSGLTSVTIPDGVTSIGAYAFSGCSGLTSVKIPEGVTSIGEYAFFGCNGLTSVTIPSSVTSIGSDAFYDCKKLTTVYVDEGDAYRVRTMMSGSGIDIRILTFVEMCKISFDVNGGDEVVEAKSVCLGDPIGRLPIPMRAGYEFLGWFTAASGGTQVSADTVITAAVTFFAQWTANAYSVKFDANGGVGTMTDASMTYDAAKALTANGFTRAGCVFAGWATSKDGEIVYADGAGVKNLVSSGATALYAKWVAIGANAYAISFNANGGTGVMEPLKCEAGRVYKLPKCGFAKPEGKTRFAGWAGSNGRRYDDEMLIFNLAQPGETVRMTAIWE